jgi:hypothetical protein
MTKQLPWRQIITILTTLGCLIAILVLKQRCGAATATLFDSISQSSPGDGGARD